MKAEKSLFLSSLCLVALQVSLVSAIENYYMCLECFMSNPEDHFYCNAED